MNTKQVIVLRTDLRNQQGNKIRTGKCVTQGGHGAQKSITDRGIIMSYEETSF
jgi:hypothetical protein